MLENTQILRVARVIGSQIITQSPITIFCFETKKIVLEQIWQDYTCGPVYWASLGPKHDKSAGITQKKYYKSGAIHGLNRAFVAHPRSNKKPATTLCSHAFKKPFFTSPIPHFAVGTYLFIHTWDKLHSTCSRDLTLHTLVTQSCSMCKEHYRQKLVISKSGSIYMKSKVLKVTYSLEDIDRTDGWPNL